ncbi:virion structural protein [Betalipothrixvirus pezzuloense]|uniref:Viral structural protein n=1 Tax=Betalipothrixvirus pezzuloense TaxID=346883 RepID=A7WKS2_9VIRU|nr:virion structural protein [Acidianus filamentous virus 7]CAJ31675.1 conserved hypothetical protein [Acidianus filamentous virus 7]
MVNLFHFKKEIKTSRSLFVSTKAEVPLVLMVAIGKRHAVGIGEIDDKSAIVEKFIPPFGAKPTPEEIARELLRKLDVPSDQWDAILATRKEIIF